MKLINTIKEKSAEILEVKLIEGRFLACWYGRENFRITNRIVFEIYNIESEDILKSVETCYCCYRNMISLDEKLIIFTSENDFEVLDFKTRKKENTIVLRDLNQCSLKFIEKFKSTDYKIKEVNGNQILTVFDDIVELWDLDGSLIKSFNVGEKIQKFSVSEDFFIYEAYAACKPESYVGICWYETGQLLVKFERSYFVGCTPHEIIIRSYETLFENKYNLDVYALDDVFTYLGVLNTEKIHHEPIYDIEYVQESSSLIFKDHLGVAFVKQKVKRSEFQIFFWIFIG